jgi:hypothetical protein
MCPAASTKVFTGSGLDYAVASDGKRYRDLPNAFAYRKKLNPNCTCNGRTVGGLVTQDAQHDPSLRPGDIVATNEGFVTYRGQSSRGARFAPVKDRKLADVQIRPTAPAMSAAALAASARSEEPAPRQSEEPASRESRRRAQR